VGRSIAERIMAPQGSMMDEDYAETCRRTVDTVSRLFVLISEWVENGISSMDEEGLHYLAFDWIDASEPDYAEPLDRLFSIVPTMHDCASRRVSSMKGSCARRPNITSGGS